MASSFELSMLAAGSLLGIAHLLVVAQFSRQQFGVKWVGNARVEPRPPMTGVGGRVERAYRNFLETFPYFIAAVVVVTMTRHANHVSALGATAYVIGCLAYAIL